MSLRPRILARNVSPPQALFASLGSDICKPQHLAVAAEKVAGVKPSDLWALMSGMTLAGISLQSNILILLYGLVLLIMGVIINIMTFRPVLRRVQAFEDILTIAKAYRKRDRETTKPPAEPSLTVTG